MTFEEFLNKVSQYMALDTLDGYLEAKNFLGLNRGKFTDPKQLEEISNISSSIMLFSGELIAQEYSSRNKNRANFDADDDDDDEIVSIQVGAGKNGKIHFISGDGVATEFIPDSKLLKDYAPEG
jgi:hypothetical protein